MPPAHMPLQELLGSYADGDEHGWDVEFAFLRDQHADALLRLRNSVVERGVQRPVLLGSDGRVWDGHHRLCVAADLDLASVPVVYA